MLTSLALTLGGCPAEKVFIYVPVPADSAASGDLLGDAGGDAAAVSHLDGAELPGDLDTGGSAEVPTTSDASQIVCTPDGWYCLDDFTSAKCNSTGDGHAEYWDCTPGVEICSIFDGRCREVICMPGDKKCASDNAYTVCRPDGTGYLPPTVCGEDMLCNGQGTCVLASCIGTVLFVVDVSGSMGLHWDAVKNSVASLEGNNPFARFGLWTFPTTGTACGVNGSPAVPISDTAMPDILAWFDTNLPYGQTPLVDSFQMIASNAASLFGADGGAVVLLSDGADTCAYTNVLDPVQNSALKVADLTQAATSLYTNHDVSTYVIGYQYTGDPAQLDAIAANGGTDQQTYTEAGSEQELANALINVLDDLKLCLQP